MTVRDVYVAVVLSMVALLAPVGAHALVPTAAPTPSGSLVGKVAMRAIVDGSHTFVCLEATAWRRDGGAWAKAGTSDVTMGGDYRIDGLSAGAHRVGFADTCGQWEGRVQIATQFHPDALEVGRAEDVAVTDGAVTSVPNTSLSPSNDLNGHLYAETGKNFPEGLSGLRVSLYRHDGAAWRIVAETRTENGGWYFDLIPAGSYRVGFARGHQTYRQTFHAGALTLAKARTVHVPAGDFDDYVSLPDNRTWRKGAKVSVTSDPALRGRARVGRVLRVTRGAYAQEGVTVRHQWQVKRNGRFHAIKGATRATYKLKARHVGARLRVRVVVSKPGYKVRTLRTDWSRPVRR